MPDITHSVPCEVNDKVALVTGAASGIGKAIALLLHAPGARSSPKARTGLSDLGVLFINRSS